MNFPYTKVIDFPKHQKRERFLPWIRFGIFNPKSSYNILYPLGLVDSGSEITFITHEFAENLGYDIKKGRKVEVVGVGGGKIQEEFGFLNRFYATVAPSIFHYAGRIDLFIPGETGLVAVFEEGDSLEDHSIRAVRAALEMSDSLDRLNEMPDPGKFLDVSIGIARGEVVTGNIGVPDCLDYRVVGPAVNVAIHLAREGRDWGEVLINDSAREQASEIVGADVKEFVITFGEEDMYFSVIKGLYEG